MAFPDPKPRNIQKKIKVFPWKTLGQMLMKVMGKYRADRCAITTTSTVNLYQQERAMEKMNLSYDPTPTVTRLGAYAPTSQPDYLTPHTNNIKPETYPNSPRSTSNSTHSSSSSWQSTTNSPNISHGNGLPTTTTTTGQASQLEPLPLHSPPSIFAQGAKYSGLQYPYTATSDAVGHGAMQATAGSQATWNYDRYASASNTVDDENEEKPRIM
ncbi:MAG: hypothetical protein Q9184_008151 [Pyrenodesmia sp. 2 TL-2023]